MFQAIFVLLRTFFISHAALAAENLALRQQLAVLQQSVPRPRLRQRHRRFWVWLSQLFEDWRSWLIIVQPESVIRWHRQGFKWYWRWKAYRGPVGRPKTDLELRELIRQMATENPTWGAPRIQSELQLLGYQIAQSTVAKYMPRGRKPPSQTWRTFLDNHVGSLASIDFFTVPTVTFQVLFCFLVLRHERRVVAHFNITAHPTAQWTAQQMIEAFPFDEALLYLIRDRDATYDGYFRRRLQEPFAMS